MESTKTCSALINFLLAAVINMQKLFHLKGKTKLIGAGVRDSCGKSASRGDPAGESRGGSTTARGKRVPGVEINVQIDKLDFHRVCL
ncbi:hypothetical protein ACIP97_02250 [Peribacillus frigoritolerans]|uniref:hypothetical protein n=1 Tax=Peribacillus frigoritolerans TaxID=450367 RepID=UPI0037F77D7F